MSDATRRLSVRLTLDGAQPVKAGLRDVGESGDRALQKITTGAQTASRALSLLGPVLAGLSIGGIARLLRGAVDAVGGLGELADQAGVSTDALQAFGFAATQAGISNEELQRSLAALTRKISDAAAGEKTAEQAFSSLGVAFLDASGRARSTEAVLADLADKIAAVESPAERAAIATAAFGDRLGQRMIPFLAQGREGLQAMIEQALRFGAVADADLIAKADEAADKIAALERAFGSLATNLLARVAPALASVADGLNRVIQGSTVAERRAQLQANQAALQARLAELEAEAGGQTGLSSQPRRGTIQRGAAGTAREQAGVDRAGLIDEIRQQLQEVDRELASLEAEAAAYQARADAILNPPSRGAPTQRPTTAVAAVARDTVDTEAVVARALEGMRQEYDRLLASIDPVEAALQRYARQQEVLTRAVENGAISEDEFADAVRRTSEALAETIEKAEKRTENASQGARELGFSFSSAFEDAILRGKRFSDVLKGIAQDIARIILRRSITEPLGNAIASAVPSFFADGGVMTGSGPVPLRRYARGGVASSPQLAMFGEGDTPEAYVPLPDGRAIPVRMEGGGGGISVVQNFHVDARGADQAVIPRLRAEMAMIARAATAELIDAVQRGGSTAKVFGRRA